MSHCNNCNKVELPLLFNMITWLQSSNGHKHLTSHSASTHGEDLAQLTVSWQRNLSTPGANACKLQPYQLPTKPQECTIHNPMIKKRSRVLLRQYCRWGWVKRELGWEMQRDARSFSFFSLRVFQVYILGRLLVWCAGLVEVNNEVEVNMKVNKGET